eukprot:248812-Chlamydomonas_euryale.AAC.1
MMTASQSSPPRCGSPPVDRTCARQHVRGASLLSLYRQRKKHLQDEPHGQDVRMDTPFVSPRHRITFGVALFCKGALTDPCGPTPKPTLAQQRPALTPSRLHVCKRQCSNPPSHQPHATPPCFHTSNVPLPCRPPGWTRQRSRPQGQTPA